MDSKAPKSAGPGAPPAGRRLVSLKDAATMLGVSVATVRRLVWTGKLPGVRLTRRLQVDIRDLDQLIERVKDRTTVR